VKAADNNGLAKPGVAYTAATAAANNDATPDFSAADLAAGAKARTAAEKKRKTAGSPTAAETEAEDAAYLKAVLNSLALRQKAADANFGAEADFVVTMSGEDAGVSYSAGLTIDETDGPAIGALTLASSGFSITYHKDNLSAITTTGADGEDDNIGDLKIAYAGNGLTADYTVDTDNDDNPYVANFGYEIAGFTVGVKVDDSTDGNKKGGVEAVNTFSVGYTMGDIAIKASADSQKDQDWDASVAYTMGDTVLTFATDEQEAHSIAVKTTLDAVSLSAKYTMQDKDKADAVTEVTLGYTMGDVTLGVTYDSANEGKFGDEAQTVVSASYTIGGIVIGAKANDQNEYEVSTAFTF